MAPIIGLPLGTLKLTTTLWKPDDIAIPPNVCNR